MDRLKIVGFIAIFLVIYSLKRILLQREKKIVNKKTNVPRIDRFLSTEYTYLHLWNMLSDYKSVWSYKNVNQIGRKDLNEEGLFYIQRTIQSMMLLSVEERRRKLKDLRSIFLKGINNLQNPANCSTSRVLICRIAVPCGFGCVTHYLANCMLNALYTRRTMIYVHGGWGYNKEGWEHMFQPIGKCTIDEKTDIKSIPYMEDVQWGTETVTMQIKLVASWVPFIVPAEFGNDLLPNHGDPFAWWIGQVVSYLMRPKPWVIETFEKSKSRIGFVSPCVGIQVRRGDKLEKEAQYHKVDEYMYYAEQWFDQLEIDNAGIPRTVYVATEDPSVLPELREKYPGYNFITYHAATSTIYSKDDRYRAGALENVLMDIFFLSQCDFIVCTLSSNVCRVSYELMQNKRVDAAERIQSLDIPYRFKWSLYSRWKAIGNHFAPANSGELTFMNGAKISVPYDHRVSFNSGYLNGSLWSDNHIYNKPFPSYKAREKIQTISYRLFKDVRP